MIAQEQSPLRQAIKQTMMRLLPKRAFIAQGQRESRAVCLTFDDGPHPEHTPRLLDVLRDNGMLATFFVVGERVGEHPDIVRRMVAEGHAIGGHSYSHGDPQETDGRTLGMEAEQTCQLIREVCGKAPALFRPPHGKLSGDKLYRLWQARQCIVLWNRDPKDYGCDSAEQVAQYFEKAPASAGDIVLLHDTHPHASALMPALAAATRRRGLGFATIDQWAGRRWLA